MRKRNWEPDQGGYLCHDECDGGIITVGHKDQVSSSCITLTFANPSLSQSVNVPNSDILQVENKPPTEQPAQPYRSQTGFCFSQNLYRCLEKADCLNHIPVWDMVAPILAT